MFKLLQFPGLSLVSTESSAKQASSTYECLASDSQSDLSWSSSSIDTAIEQTQELQTWQDTQPLLDDDDEMVMASTTALERPVDFHYHEGGCVLKVYVLCM